MSAELLGGDGDVAGSSNAEKAGKVAQGGHEGRSVSSAYRGQLVAVGDFASQRSRFSMPQSPRRASASSAGLVGVAVRSVIGWTVSVRQRRPVSGGLRSVTRTASAERGVRGADPDADGGQFQGAPFAPSVRLVGGAVDDRKIVPRQRPESRQEGALVGIDGQHVVRAIGLTVHHGLSQHHAGVSVERGQQVHRPLVAGPLAGRALSVERDHPTRLPRRRASGGSRGHPGHDPLVQTGGTNGLRDPASRGLTRRPTAQPESSRRSQISCPRGDRDIGPGAGQHRAHRHPQHSADISQHGRSTRPGDHKGAGVVMITGGSRVRPACAPSPACHPHDTPKVTTVPGP